MCMSIEYAFDNLSIFYCSKHRQTNLNILIYQYPVSPIFSFTVLAWTLNSNGNCREILKTSAPTKNKEKKKKKDPLPAYRLQIVMKLSDGNGTGMNFEFESEAFDSIKWKRLRHISTYISIRTRVMYA